MKGEWGEEMAHYHIISCIISMQPYRLKTAKMIIQLKGFLPFNGSNLPTCGFEWVVEGKSKVFF